MTERTTVRLPPQLLRRAKRKAAEQARTLTALIVEGLRLVTADRPPGVEPERVMPRVSSASGGVLPGVDLTSLARLQEADDADLARRLREPN